MRSFESECHAIEINEVESSFFSHHGSHTSAQIGLFLWEGALKFGSLYLWSHTAIHFLLALFYIVREVIHLRSEGLLSCNGSYISLIAPHRIMKSRDFSSRLLTWVLLHHSSALWCSYLIFNYRSFGSCDIYCVTILCTRSHRLFPLWDDSRFDTLKMFANIFSSNESEMDILYLLWEVVE